MQDGFLGAMLIQLPFELLHEIILLNDDQITKEGPVATYLDASAIHSEFIPERPKPCAGSVARVCKSWHSFIKNSPRLRLSCLMIANVRHGGKDPQEERKAALDEAFVNGILTSNADLDIFIGHSYPDWEEIVSAIDRLLCGTVGRWRWLGIDECFGKSSDLWISLVTGLTSTPRLRGIYYTGCTGWLASVKQWRAPRLETVEVLDHYEPTGSTKLPELTQPFKNVFKRAKYSSLMGYLLDDDFTHQRILLLYRVFPLIENLHLSVGEHQHGSERYLRVSILSDCEPDTEDLAISQRHLALSGSERFIIRCMKSFPVQDMHSLSIRAAGAATDLHEPFETPNLLSLQLEVFFPRLSSTLSYVECKNLTFLGLDICARTAVDVSLDRAFPALLRFRLRRGGKPFWAKRMTFDVGNLSAPNLQELFLTGVLKKPILGYTIKPILPNLRKVVLGSLEQSASSGDLDFLSAFNAPMLKVLDLTHCRIGDVSIPGAEAIANTIKDALATIEDMHVADLRELVVFQAFVRFMPKLVTLQMRITESVASDFLWFLGACGKDSMNLPLLMKLEIHMHKTWSGECCADEVVRKLVDAILARREVGLVELVHISLKVFDELQYQEACRSQLREVFTNQTNFELCSFDGTQLLFNLTH